MAALFRLPVFRSLICGTPLCRWRVLVSRPCFSTHTSSEEDDKKEVFVQHATPIGWDVKASTEAYYFFMDMPGLREEHIKFYMAENNCVLVKGQKEKEEDDEEETRRYSYQLTLEENSFKPEAMEAKMKDGVLMLAIPQLNKGEEPKRPCFSTHTSSEDDKKVFVQHATPIGWDVKASTEAYYFFMDMPGLRGEHIKFYMAENNCVLVKGRKEKEEDDEEETRRYSYRLTLEENSFKPEAMQAEMKHGVLMLAIPQLKKE